MKNNLKDPYRKARRLSTERLKELWDSYDGIKTADPEISGEEIHTVLNERGKVYIVLYDQ